METCIYTSAETLETLKTGDFAVTRELDSVDVMPNVEVGTFGDIPWNDPTPGGRSGCTVENMKY